MRNFLRLGILALGLGIIAMLVLIRVQTIPEPAPPAPSDPPAAPSFPTPILATSGDARVPGRAPGAPLDPSAALQDSTTAAVSIMSEEERSARNEQLIKELEKQKSRMGIIGIIPPRRKAPPPAPSQDQ